MSPTRFENSHEIDEETLPDQEDLKPTQTLLPTGQICILLTAWLAESIFSHSISPYLNQLVRELPEVGGDARKVGYYTGIIASLHYAADAATSLQWNRLSDHVGRKPVLLSCIALSPEPVLARRDEGTSGVIKSMIAELTDETNIARGFSMPPVAWSLGYVIGPQDRWPDAFSHPFWADYPYFLPCFVAATFMCFSFVITTLYLEETMNLRPSAKLQHARVNSDSPQEDAGDSPDLDMRPNQPEKPPPLRSVLTKPVAVTVANYAMLAFLDTVSTPVEYGGLNLNPASIGLWLSLYGAMRGFFQSSFFSHFVSRFGSHRVFVLSISSCAVIYAIFPFENLAVVTGGGPNMAVCHWMLIILQLSSLCIFDMGYCKMNMFVSSAAPNKRLLGAVYGLSHVAISVLRIVGPGADWLFAFSLTHNVLGGKLAYVVLLGVVCVTLGISTQLPKNSWARREE
ncbi:MFS general substrate transporter [Lactarius akahatsu]|uniref:MFS general substrate transporter n=1 Tax=Lactarius akahatsu TaxID=416441 RepID=A0AAD4LBR7_9AGAM|nr:MFS general substrate transporter [Lactarius akahatsu]